jgi:MioC protein
LNTLILHGTESGNAEMAADDLADFLSDTEWAATVTSMSDVDVSDLARTDRVVIITSTYGDGGLPDTAVPFQESLTAQNPDLSAVTFCAFGLGDSTYETYNNAVSVLAGDLIRRGATQIGSTGLHDANSGSDPSRSVVTWAEALFASE